MFLKDEYVVQHFFSLLGVLEKQLHQDINKNNKNKFRNLLITNTKKEETV